VLVIIAILAGLISAVAYRGIARAKVARISMEIQQISRALEQYKQQFGEYPPDFSDVTSDNGKSIILRHISKAFPRYIVPDWNTLRDLIKTNSQYTINSINYQINLDKMSPDRALVFWLGGMPDAQGKPSGFSKNPANPFESPNTTPSRIGPFFEFNPEYMPITPPLGPTDTLPIITNVYKYYSPGLSKDSNHQYIYLRAELGQPEPKREYYSYDNTKTPPYTIKKGASSGAQPYWDQRNQGWENPDSFQILCCGLDGKFGKENVYPTGLFADAGVPDGTSGGLPNLTADVIGTDSIGFPAGNFDHIDDQTNFTKGTIGDDLP
ncbi:MAG: type II secretion system protein, partial [Thermoguttaceae bacterium]